jgi:very-short-patch-repair endonuclease
MIHNHVPSPNRRNARKMRKAMTDAELKLWNELRAHRLMNLGFRRQLPIAGYIVDFACPEKQLIVEVDGSQHGEQADADSVRDLRLEALGWMVIRFWNDDVLRDIDGVCQHIITVAGLDRPEQPFAATIQEEHHP